MTERPLGAQISHMLKDRGVDVIFGIPGVHNQEMYRGIEEAGLTHVLARHEQGAGFMADGYARATGRPGVCYVITGPGLTNILTPMGQAASDSVPMLVISSCLDETAARKGQLHQMSDQRGAGVTVSAWSEEARTADAAYQLIDRALEEFGPGQRHAPRHMQVPIATLTAAAPTFPPAGQTHPTLTCPTDAVEQVARLLERANRPLFVFGGGVAMERDAPVSRYVPEKFAAACFVTYAGRGTVDPEDQLFFGSYLARPESAGIFASADLVIAVGTELAEVDLWRKHLGFDCQLVRVDVEPRVLTDGQLAYIRIRADANAFLRALAAHPSSKKVSGWTSEEVAGFRRKARAEVEAEFPGVARVADALRACLPADTMVFSDMTQFAYASKEIWDMSRPGHWHHPYGFGTLGYALPAAIGGAVARRAQPTLAIAGDYGFQYTCNELGTAVELGLSLPIFLWDNGKLGAIEASMTSAQIAPNAVIAQNPDFGLLARAYGAGYAEPATLGQMQQAVSDAFGAPQPTLIRVTPKISD